jgi:hypothetical protein
VHISNWLADFDAVSSFAKAQESFGVARSERFERCGFHDVA